ncbi:MULTISPECIES: ribosome maturation factor RimM [Dictyoglomus]|uniref:Ribosome maturation factor RimM n=1 Tax=Dictyoglomus turgidum (strain DSM 6724 / Z-1310) TaxID=515635 RepID=B8E2G5_DICTD|nr:MULTISPECIES: ribosome maturation factor RimM [Dictyoglomus]ACK42809.1 16S rRNA processing protein RimM [Dictyoglomus turgidum DSM 6724]PNV80984.1 MAG: 16S rRNA processing protein RimM [Dictyoglomus turgidum]HBU30868.1 16S rRNA processing protein RimM [Dictyoglomus sp.]
MVRIAKLGEPFGIKGGIKIWPFFDLIDTLKKGQKIYLSWGDTLLVRRELSLENIREHNKGYVIYFSEIETREDAEKIRGNWLLIEEEDLPKLPEGQYYTYQIMGLSVYEESGEYLGKVKEILETGSNDVYIVEGEDEDIYIPAIKDVIVEINLDEGKIIIRKMEEY